MPHLLILFILFVNSHAGYASEESSQLISGDSSSRRLLRAAYTEFPPYTYTDSAGKPAGIYIDLFLKTVENAGYHGEFFSAPNARIYFMLKAGEIDLWLGVADTPALQAHVVEVPVDPFSITLKLWYMNGTKPANSLLDVGNKKLVVINGFTYSNIVDQANSDLSESGESLSVLKSSGHASALKILASGRADYMLNYEEPVKEMLKINPVPDLNGSLIRKRRLAFVISKYREGSAQIHKDLSQSFEAIKDIYWPAKREAAMEFSQ
ncbi:MAG TPA: transporter substrate-binding domain-containing protein [Porticoccus sp.]|nr:transporter substrate-binding domain-containing protein [Porticoccus sp.]